MTTDPAALHAGVIVDHATRYHAGTVAVNAPAVDPSTPADVYLDLYTDTY